MPRVSQTRFVEIELMSVTEKFKVPRLRVSTTGIPRDKVDSLQKELRSLKGSYNDLRNSLAPLNFQLNFQLEEEFALVVSKLVEEFQRRSQIMHDSFLGQKREYRKRIKEKYRMKTDTLIQKFAKEREEILTVVKFECSEILSDAKSMFLRTK